MGAVGGGFVEHHARDDDLGMLLQLRAQALAEIGHLLEIGDVTVVNPLHHLVGAEFLFAEILDEETLHALPIQIEQVLPCGRASADRRGLCVRGQFQFDRR